MVDEEVTRQEDVSVGPPAYGGKRGRGRRIRTTSRAEHLLIIMGTDRAVRPILRKAKDHGAAKGRWRSGYF